MLVSKGMWNIVFPWHNACISLKIIFIYMLLKPKTHRWICTKWCQSNPFFVQYSFVCIWKCFVSRYYIWNTYIGMGAKCVILVIKNNLCISEYTYVMTFLVYMESPLKCIFLVCERSLLRPFWIVTKIENGMIHLWLLFLLDYVVCCLSNL